MARSCAGAKPVATPPPPSLSGMFLTGGQPRRAQTDRKNLMSGSANITADNTFNSPDGLAFDAEGRLWIQTDGKYSNQGDYAGQGNNQMLCADPVTKEIRRFLVGPKECEVTGITFTPDHTTMFINIQHPGEEGDSHWPGWWHQHSSLGHGGDHQG